MKEEMKEEISPLVAKMGALMLCALFNEEKHFSVFLESIMDDLREEKRKQDACSECTKSIQ